MECMLDSLYITLTSFRKHSPEKHAILQRQVLSIIMLHLSRLLLHIFVSREYTNVVALFLTEKSEHKKLKLS